VDADLVIPGTEINLGKDFGIMELVNEVIDERNGKAVLDGDFVEGSIINAHPEFSSLLLDKNDRGSIRGETGFDRAILEEFVQFFSQGI
jgi:hypothetical protein